MTKFMTAGLALALGLTLFASPADAQSFVGRGPIGRGPVGPVHVHRPVGPVHVHRPIVAARPVVVAPRHYYHDHGVRFRGGYYFPGHVHASHWQTRVWNTQYSRYHYWDADLGCYYYWSPAQSAYYPVGW